MAGPEALFKEKVRDTLAGLGPDCFFFKVAADMASAGLPDFVGWIRDACPFAFELKATRKGQLDWSLVTELQRGSLKRARAAGAAAGVLWWHDRARVLLFVDAQAVPHAEVKWSEGVVSTRASHEGHLIAHGAPMSRATSGPSWHVRTHADGDLRTARVAAGVKLFPLRCLLAAGFGATGLEVAARHEDASARHL